MQVPLTLIVSTTMLTANDSPDTGASGFHREERIRYGSARADGRRCPGFNLNPVLGLGRGGPGMIGGRKAVEGDIPGMIGLTRETGTAEKDLKNSNYGGGILLSAEQNGRGAVLTAAHCLKYDLNTVTVHGGSLLWEQPGFTAKVKEYYVHPDYAPPLGIDLAVLILDGVPTNAQTAPALAGSDDAGLYAVGNTVTLAGWGPEKLNGANPESLQVLAMPLVLPSSCNKAGRKSNEDFACCKKVNGDGSSPGDSGGPVLGGAENSRRLVAVIEGGIGASIATRVDKQREWILNPAGIHSYVVGSAPVAVAVARDGRKFVAHAPEGKQATVTVLLEDWTMQASIAVPGRPSAIVVSADGARAYVADWQANQVLVIDTENASFSEVKVPSSPTALAITSDGSRLYVLNGEAVSVVNTGTMQVLTSLNLGRTATALAVAPGDALVYVTSEQDSKVKIIDTAANIVTATWDVGEWGNTSIAVAADRIYIGSGQDVHIRDGAGVEQRGAEIPGDRLVKSLALSGAGLYVGYETNNSSNLAQAGVQIFKAQDVRAGSCTRELGGAPLASLTPASAGQVLAVNRDVSSISIIAT
jgi:YVTN family beta-propeller protein